MLLAHRHVWLRLYILYLYLYLYLYLAAFGCVRLCYKYIRYFAAEKRTHHSPAVVAPLAVSAGGGMFPEDDDRLPCGGYRNGRHWLRAELISTFLKYRTALTWQLWKRRPNGVFAQAVAFSRVQIVPRTGVFCSAFDLCHKYILYLHLYLYFARG